MLRKIALTVMTVVTAAIALLMLWPQAVGAQRAPGVAHIVSFRAVFALVAVVLVVLLLLITLVWHRVRTVAAIFVVQLLLFATVTGAILGTRGFGNDSASAAARENSGIVILSWNTLGGSPGVERIAELALRLNAQVVSLPETTEHQTRRIAALMAAAGHPMAVHSLTFNRTAKSSSTSVLISRNLGRYSIDTTRGSTSILPTVVLIPEDATNPTIVAAHPVAPVPGYFSAWQRDLLWLRGICTGTNVILAGDLNSSLDHESGLGNSDDATIGDCRDAALATGNAAVGTWPTRLPALLGTPIDHVMATPNWTISDFRVITSLDQTGSDHRPIMARLVPSTTLRTGALGAEGIRRLNAATERSG